MAKNPTIIRISDIAEMAGVSVGTVDRVIHNRGRVSEENLKKVQAVLDRVNYQPNVMARSLAAKKHYHIVTITPSFIPGQYWESMSNGIDKAASELEPYNIHITKLFFDQYDNNSFEKVIETLPEEEPDGVLIATLFTESVIRLSQSLDKDGIPYVFVDSDIPDKNNLAYFGTNSYDSGLIAAKLLLEKVNSKSDILIPGIVHSGKNDSNQGKNRKEGFCDYLRKAKFEGNIHQVELKLNDPAYNFTVLDKVFKEKPRIEGAVMFNSTCYLLGDYLKATEHKEIKLIGYDLIKRNMDLLSEDVVFTLITQRPDSQGYNAIKAISNLLIFNQQPEKINLMPIDILIKENLKYYLNYKL